MDWSKASDDMVQEIVRVGESYLQGQLQLATSADQRAAVLASVYTASGGALVAGLITLASADTPAFDVRPIFAGGVVAALLFLVAASLCVWALRPVGFYLPGGQPKSWYKDAESGQPLRKSLEQQAEHYQGRIDDNRTTLAANARHFRIGAILGIAAPAAGFIIWLIFSYCRLAS